MALFAHALPPSPCPQNEPMHLPPHCSRWGFGSFSISSTMVGSGLSIGLECVLLTSGSM